MSFFPSKRGYSSILFLHSCYVLITISTFVFLGSHSQSTLSQYEPIAMDESVEYLSRHAARKADRDAIFMNSKSESELMDNLRNFGLDNPEVLHRGQVKVNKNKPYDGRKIEDILKDVTDENADPRKNLYKVPDKPSKRLSDLISNSNPSFAFTNITSQTVRKNDTDDKGKKILAKYTVYIPFFIPAVKPKLDVKQTTKTNIEYKKETKKEMVPVKKIVPRVRETIVAEPIRQRVITDYVSVDGNHIPEQSSDRITASDDVVSREVTQFD